MGTREVGIMLEPKAIELLADVTHSRGRGEKQNGFSKWLMDGIRM